MVTGWGASMFIRTGLPRPTSARRWILACLMVMIVALLLAASASPALAAGIVDAGFESRADGTALDSSIWTLAGVPQRAEYDTLRAKNGTGSGWIQGPTTAAYAGAFETNSAAMASNGAEVQVLGLPRHCDPAARRHRRRHQREPVLRVAQVRLRRDHRCLHEQGGHHRLHPQRLHHRRHLRGRLDRVPRRLRLHDADLHALQARHRHRHLDAAQVRRRRGYGIPMRGTGDHHAPRDGLFFRAVPEREHVARRHRLHRRRHHRPRHHATGRARRLSLATPGHRAASRPDLDRQHRPDLSGYNVYRARCGSYAAPIPRTPPTPTPPLSTGTYSYPCRPSTRPATRARRSIAAVATVGNTVDVPPSGSSTPASSPAADGTALDSSTGRSPAPRRRPSTTPPAPRTAPLSGWIQGPTTAAYAGAFETNRPP